MEAAGHRIAVVEGDARILKLQRPVIWPMPNFYCVRSKVGENGQGVDVHAFDQIGSADSVRLGGVDIPHDRQLIAHSDGDVVLHALMDALLGAAALGDIGQHFSDTDPAYAGADSMALLKQVVK